MQKRYNNKNFQNLVASKSKLGSCKIPVIKAQEIQIWNH